MKLTIYDISGIQTFIFASSKLKEQVGGSKIVRDILYQILPKSLETTKEEAEKNENIFDFSTKPYHIVYIGGGNALVLYEDQEVMEEKTREMEKKILRLTNGALRLCSASVEVDFNKTYGELYQELMEKMAEVKSLPNEIKLATVFGINEYDTVSLEPLTLLTTDKYGVATYWKKRETFRNYNSEKNQDFHFTNQFDELRDENKKSYVAVVHIDGDSMGKQIMNVMNKRDEKVSTQNEMLDSMLLMRALSIEIDQLYEESLKNTLDLFFEDEKKKNETAKFRKIIADGDDITFIIAAEKAFDFVECFMENLRKCKDLDSKKYMKENEFKVSASAGIIFVHDKYPFDEAYHLSEELCRLAKKKKRESERNYVSNMDFHIISPGLKRSIKEFREENYRKGKISLEIRPYYYDGKNEINSYHSFKELRKMVKGDKRIARSKLKSLRNAYGDSKQAADRYHSFIKSRENGGITGEKEETAFYTTGEWNNRARFFDALDSMDF